MAPATNGKPDNRDDSSGIRIFVYGTLKKGHPNHRLIEAATFLGRHQLEETSHLIDLGYYPGVVRARPAGGESAVVRGEVYRVTSEMLDAVDVLEGHPNYYQRFKISTPWKSAWCYFLPVGYAAKYGAILNGLWNPSDEEQEFWSGEEQQQTVRADSA